MAATTDRTPDDRTVPVFEALPPERLVATANPDLIRAAIELFGERRRPQAHCRCRESTPCSSGRSSTLSGARQADPPFTARLSYEYAKTVELSVDGRVTGLHYATGSREIGQIGDDSDSVDAELYEEYPFRERSEALAEPIETIQDQYHDWI